ncbi:MAG: thiamine pyrophosphate-dependent enzyme [Pyrodictiaceae archaeon]
MSGEETFTHYVDDLLRVERLPHIWCPGCGIGIVLQSFLRAVKALEAKSVIDRKQLVVISGIGCTGRAAGYVRLDGAHTPHGRPIAYAYGVKLANPRLIPVVFSGDGDIAGIGGNHLLHAARRNFDMLVIMVNNFNYALTGGQVAPTTPQGVYTTTTPAGNPERPLDVAKFVASMDVNYVARWSIHYPFHLEEAIKKAITKKGFRFIEVLSICPEIFGRHIGMRDPVELYDRLKKVAKIKKPKSLDDIKYDWDSEITLGEFVNQSKPSYIESLCSVYKYEWCSEVPELKWG